KRIYNFSSSDNIFQFSSISFDTSIEEIFLTLTSGSALVINSEKKIADAHELIKTLSEENISVLDFPTAYWTYFSQQLYQDKLQLPKCVKKIIIGGEKANKSSLTKWNNSQSKIEFYNSYGPTETTVIASVWEFHLEKNDVIINEIPIGKAIYGYSLYVLDQSYNHLPIGAYGELFISGNAVSQGYVNKPSLTAKLFIPDPYSKIPGQRMYATGDIVKLLMDGNIEYIGRKDNQVKIRGYRVELEEISSVILQHSSVYECVILFNEITDNNKQLLAFLTVTESSSEITEKIKKYAAKKLPQYMLPNEFHIVDEIPLKINGKVDNAKLLKIAKNSKKLTAKEKELTNTENDLLELVKDILGTQQITINDNFFDVGGHSLSATQLTAKIRRKFNLDYPIRNIFEAINFEDIAKDLDVLKNKNLKTIKIQKQETNLAKPLSFAQQRLWFLNELDSKSSGYNIPTAVKIKGSLNIDLLKESLERLIERHEILRTTFETHEGIPFQKIHDSVKTNLKVINVQSENEGNSKKRAEEICIEESKRCFKLNELPLFNVICIILGPDEFVIFTNIHHIISDGWSDRIIVTEILSVYFALLNKKN
ncbi:MAG: AMP-binding protein, partial [Ignavibacteriae bacterium]|nr:AMP-binding protein [Ignavibacteriota bacterium]